MAGVPAGRAAVLMVGSGITGAYVLENRTWLGDFVRGSLRGGDGGGDGAAVKELVKNVEALAEAAGRSQVPSMSPITIIDSKSNSSSGNVNTVMIGAGVAALSTAALLLYLKRKLLASHLWVSKNTFMDTLQKMQDNVQRLSGHMQSVRNELTSRIFQVETKLSDNAAQIEAKVEDEVGHAKKRIAVVGMSVEEVQNVVDGLQKRLDDLQAKVTYANRGILLLCSIVGSIPQPERKSRRMWDELRRFTGGNAQAGSLAGEQNSALLEDDRRSSSESQDLNPLLSLHARSRSYHFAGENDVQPKAGVSIRGFERRKFEGHSAKSEESLSNRHEERRNRSPSHHSKNLSTGGLAFALPPSKQG
mmetsp:Transcript_11133/g.34124  ORF Transcript_11133/g.34124 Transcript_11133/m.34124 type:complete len:361 (+) Transcript_11133:136-1218(+)